MKHREPTTSEEREHREVLDLYRDIFKKDRLGDSEERFRVLEVFLGLSGHVSLPDMEQILKSRGVEISPEKISSYMENFTNYGIAQKVDLEGDSTLYEHLHLGAHHDHLICVKCGRIEEFRDEDIEELKFAAASSHGFLLLRHHLDIYGLCRRCKRERESIMPLALTNPGEVVIIDHISGGSGIRRRLFSMGIVPGKEIEVIKTHRPGPTIIAIDQSRIAIGRSVSKRIMVSVDSKKAS
jgi:Fur family ferric uptake transcriptional regulator